jgi:hypothetical protein
VKVEAHEDQKRGQPWMGRQTSALDERAEGEANQRAGDDVSGEGADQRERQRVQRMVILREPQQRMRCVAGQKFGDDAKAVEIRGDCGSHHQSLFTARERGGAAGRKSRGQHPSGKEVRDRTHGRSYFAADYGAKIRPKVTEAARGSIWISREIDRSRSIDGRCAMRYHGSA